MRRIRVQSRVPSRVRRGVAEEDVLGDGELGEEQELLVDGGDAAAGGLARGDGGELLVAEADAAAVGGVGAGDDLDERRLAGAVFAEERVDLAGAEVEGDVVQHADAGEGLGDAADRDERPRAFRIGAAAGCGGRVVLHQSRLPPRAAPLPGVFRAR